MISKNGALQSPTRHQQTLAKRGNPGFFDYMSPNASSILLIYCGDTRSQFFKSLKNIAFQNENCCNYANTIPLFCIIFVHGVSHFAVIRSSQSYFSRGRHLSSSRAVHQI